MTRIEIDGFGFDVPESWQDITVGRFEELSAMRPKTSRELVEYAAKACGIDAARLMAWPVDAYNAITDRIAFLWSDADMAPRPSLCVGGVEYVVNSEDKLTLGEWVDIEAAQLEGRHVISGTLAVVCRPVGEAYDPDRTAERQAMFQALPVSQVQGVLAFFLELRKRYEATTQASSVVREAAAQLLAVIEDMRSAGGGSKRLLSWRTMTSRASMRLLRCRLRRYLRTSPLTATGRKPKKRSASSSKERRKEVRDE